MPLHLTVVYECGRCGCRAPAQLEGLGFEGDRDFSHLRRPDERWVQVQLDAVGSTKDGPAWDHDHHQVHEMLCGPCSRELWQWLHPRQEN